MYYLSLKIVIVLAISVDHDERSFICFFHARMQGGGVGGQGDRIPPPSEKSQKIGFLRNTGPDPLKISKATRPDFNVGPSSARLLNAI